MRTTLTIIIVLTACTGWLWVGTDGFRAFTSEQARRLEIAKVPRTLPDVLLEDQDGRQFRLSKYRGRPILVEFIYTRCRTLCAALINGLRQVYESRRHHEASGDEIFLSISFDPDRDTAQALKEYARRYQVEGTDWRFARIEDKGALDRLLKAFGVVVIPDTFGEFQHNAAIHIVDRTGRLARILDYDAPSDSIGRILAQF
jgi:protein SCO1/2